jgi:prepilin-type N-terminal cleavage/methylation domain-containing protein
MVLTGKKAGKEKMRISRAGISSKHGFTLLELVVVLFVISLVTALVLPSFIGFGEKRLKSEAREMASILRYMNDSAISRKETFFMRFDLNEGRVYWKGPDGDRSRRFADMTGVTTQSTGKVSKGEITLFFEPLGIQESLSVYMGSGDKEMEINLNHLSGKVKIIQNEKLTHMSMSFRTCFGMT